MSPTHRFDYLSPAADSPDRRLTVATSTFILVQTMMGASILGLPYAFRSSGVILSVVFTVVNASANAMTVDMLVAASRSTGANSYEQVSSLAFGRCGRLIVMVMLVMLIWFITTSYLVLIADLVGPIIEWIFHTNLRGQTPRAIIICCAVGLVSPMLFMKDLNALRHMSKLSLCALSIVVLALIYHGATNW